MFVISCADKDAHAYFPIFIAAVNNVTCNPVACDVVDITCTIWSSLLLLLPLLLFGGVIFTVRGDKKCRKSYNYFETT